MRCLAVTTLAVVLLFGLDPVDSAKAKDLVVFDNFESGGPLALEAAGGGSDSIDQSGLRVVGGHRKTLALHTAGVGPATTATLENTSRDAALRISGEGRPNAPG